MLAEKSAEDVRKGIAYPWTDEDEKIEILPFSAEQNNGGKRNRYIKYSHESRGRKSIVELSF